MADSQAVAALQPFVLLAKNAGPAAAADIIVRATEAPGCYVFSELLELPSIQALKGHPQYALAHNLLVLFAHGSYPPPAEPPTPPLTPAQTHKLKLLTLLTLASTPPHHANLTYAALRARLELPADTRELEDLVIAAISAGLLTATLDTAQQRVVVSAAAGRDVAPRDVARMAATLARWERDCEEVLAEIEAQVALVKRQARERRLQEEEYNRLVGLKKDSVVGGGGGGKEKGGKGKRVISADDDTGMGGNGTEDMDVDDDGVLGVGSSNTTGGRELRKRKGSKLGGAKRLR